MQIKEGLPDGTVEEVVAVTMGPESAVRALHKAVSLGADRSVQLTDDALAGSDVCASGYALGQVLKQRAARTSCCSASSRTTASATRWARWSPTTSQMPSLTQVIQIDVADGKLRCERQAEYGYDTVEVELPAVISVGDAINEPRYPSLKAIMGAKKKPLDKLSAADAQIEASRVGEDGSRTKVLGAQPAAAQGEGHDHRGRGHERDGREDRRLARGKEADLDGRHPGLRPPRRRGQLQQELAGRDLRGGEARRRARHAGGRAGRVGDVSDEGAQSLGAFGASKVYRAKNVPEGLAQPIVDAMAKVIEDEDFDYVLFGGGLLGFEIGAGLTARLGAGVTMEVTDVQGAGRRPRRGAPDPPGLADRRRPVRGQAGDHHRPPERVRRGPERRRLGGGRRRGRRALALVHEGEDGHARRAARRGRQHRGRRLPRGRRPRARQGRELRRSATSSRARSAARSRRRARSWTRAGSRTRARSARPARRSRRSSTSRPASRARSSTRSACSPRRTSSRSTRTRTRRSSSSATSGSWATSTRSCPS